MRARISILVSATALSLLAGCMVGPKYACPEPLPAQPVPEAFSASALTNNAGTNSVEWKTAQPSAHVPHGNWWKVFNDAELNRLEALASENNQELAVAVARFDQARALVRVARSDLFPHLTADAGLTRQRTSFNSFDRGGPADISHTYNNYTAALDAQ